MNFGDFTDGSNATPSDYLVGYASGGGAGSDRRWPVSGVAREKLASSRTYYVRTDGSDSNDGLANTAAGAFLTIQKAIDTVAGLDINSNSVTIQVAAGTYAETVTVSGPWVGGNSVTLLGDATTPSNVQISPASGSCVTMTGYSMMNISGFKLVSTTGSALNIVRFSHLAVTGAMDFGACAAGHHFSIQSCSRITVGANYNITGSAVSHIASQEHAVWLGSGLTVTLTGTPAFSIGYAFCNGGSLIKKHGMTFSGSATGVRFVLQTNGTIDTNGGGATYFPGDSAGTGDGQSGGLYA